MMQREGFRMKCSVLVASNAILGLAALGADATSPSRSMPGFPAGAGIHETEADAQSLLAPQDASQTPALPGVEQLRTPIAPTRSSFMASWQKINGAIGYRLDVSTDASFRAFVDGYQDLDVGNVT